ncbi:glycoside hydrolase family 36 protein [Cerasicoccus arenae]|nr:glycoside hydrolase family 36 protein [Cerasicoccus arenae]MBK1859865.1 alpha-galactosidase [Cerasicoccus arenae]
MQNIVSSNQCESHLPLPENISVVSIIALGDVEAVYLRDENTQATGLMLIPTQWLPDVVKRRSHNNSTLAWTVDSLIQLKIVGDAYPKMFSQGRTMRNSVSTERLRFDGQRVVEDETSKSILTVLRDDGRYHCVHQLTWMKGEGFVEVTSTFHNDSNEPLTLEMFSSFSLGGITPFACGDAAGRLVLHRLRSAWCAEGRLESRAIEEMQLECFHYPDTPTAERFGQVGSMPVRGWHPFIAIEDLEVGVTWAAQLACPGSWQLEAHRRDDCISISGGLADREFGHWLKRINPRARFTSPTAMLTVGASLDDACERFLQRQQRQEILPIEQSLPIIYNDWCTHWGKTSHANVVEMAEILMGEGIDIFVIDAGWSLGMGSWQENRAKFPDGLAVTAKKIRECGMVPGIWFEMECCEVTDGHTHENREHLLHRDSFPIQSGQRCFWDFRDPWVWNHLSEQMIDLLEECQFGYLKIDYNDSLGIGCDGTDSLGEGLREHLECVQKFIVRIRERLPNLVIELCSSGGHRLEPSMLQLANVASFSDAHETSDIPIIAANLHRVLLPRTSQIWSVLRSGDNAQRIVYSLAATFLGRMGLSGEIDQLDEWKRDILRFAIAFYHEASAVIAYGTSKRYGGPVLSYRNPVGWQAVVRQGAGAALVVGHAFAGDPPEIVELELPAGSWRIKKVFPQQMSSPELKGAALSAKFDGEWSAFAILLVQEEVESDVTLAG